MEFDKHFILELLAALVEGTLGDYPHSDFCPHQELEELIQLILQSTFDQIEQEGDDDGEGQTTLAGEVFLVTPMASLEIIPKEQGFEPLDETLANRCVGSIHAVLLLPDSQDWTTHDYAPQTH